MTKATIKAAKKIIAPNDKISGLLFGLGDSLFQKAVRQEKPVPVREKVTDPKTKAEIITNFFLKALDSRAAGSPLTQFDRAVFNSCLSLQLAGNSFATLDVIFRTLTGKSSGTLSRAPDLKAAIAASVVKLASLSIKIPMTDICTKGGYNHREAITVRGKILPVSFVEGVKINGQPAADVIKFDGESPLAVVSRIKNQRVEINPALLAVPKQTVMSVTLRHYCALRVAEILKSRKSKTSRQKLSPTLRLDSIFEDCGLSAAADSSKNRAREVIFSLFEELKRAGEIVSYSAAREGLKYISVKFVYEHNQRD